MSWWIYLENEKGEAVEVTHHSEGGTYVLGGTSIAELNVTYNYGKHFDFKELNGITGREAIPLLTKTVGELGIARDNDYWKPTRGNVGHACRILLIWACLHPQAIFRVN